jgi:hypothetical protein
LLAEGRDNVNALVEAYGDNCTIEIWWVCGLANS